MSRDAFVNQTQDQGVEAVRLPAPAETTKINMKA